MFDSLNFIVRIKNRWTFDQTLFNPIRAKRPMNNNMENKSATEVADEFDLIPDRCDFCSPIAYTAVGMFKKTFTLKEKFANNDYFQTLFCLFIHLVFRSNFFLEIESPCRNLLIIKAVSKR